MKFDFETFLAVSPNPYVILDPELVMVWMNDAYLGATMRSRGELVGRKMFDAFPVDEASESYRLLRTSFERVRETCEVDEIALIRYDIETPDGTKDVRYWSATHTPICEDGELRYIMQHTVDVTELQQLRQVGDAMGIIRRANAVQEQNRSLQTEAQRLLDFFEQAPGFTAVLVGPDHRFGMVNEAYCDLVGRKDLIGAKVEDALPEVADQGFIDILNTAYATGEPYFGRGEGVHLKSAGGDATELRYLNFIFQPIFDDHDAVSGIIIQGYDVTQETEAQERQELLVNELNHRVKNTLAIVQGLAMQSFRAPGSQAERRVFEARLMTLAAAHSLLTEGSWGEASVDEIVAKSAEATLGEAMNRIRAKGDAIRLPPQTAVSLAMVVHELCTNALKYGALSNDTGIVDVQWSLGRGEEREFCLEWKESGGPVIAAPERAGFGSRLISRGIGDQSKSSVDMQYAPDGLRCRVTTVLGSG